jgi:diaminopimelate epimerase
MAGAGNLFVVVDAVSGERPDDLPAFARASCREPGPGGRRADGVLLVSSSPSSGNCAMTVYNADGSRPEMCGNGLRCVAKLAFERGYTASRTFTIDTDAGPRPVTVEVAGGRVSSVTVRMGTPRILARGEKLQALGGEHVAVLVDVGNPHCVLFVDDVATAPVTTLGPALEKHARFPQHTNVEFLALATRPAKLRVWERGVGETQACGSGACAAAWAAVDAGRARWPVELDLPGGRLTIDSDGDGGVTLRGPVEELSAPERTPAAPRA